VSNIKHLAQSTKKGLPALAKTKTESPYWLLEGGTTNA
jgi:hypothetical protein